jgi:glycerol kinase
MLMDLETLDWDDELISFFNIPRSMLPKIVPSSDPEGFGKVRADGPLGAEVAITGVLGDQQAATVGRSASPSARRRTPTAPATSCCSTPVRSSCGPRRPADDRLLPVRRQQADLRARGLDRRHRLRDPVAARPARHHRRRRGERDAGQQVDDNGTRTSCPRSPGLFAPYWRSDARGAIVGLSRFNNKSHIARAALEAICYQSRDVVEAMAKDSGVDLEVLKVDGGVTANDLCMQLQADILGVRSASPSSPRRPPSALPTRPVSRSASGRTPTSCARTGTRTSAGLPTWDEDKREKGYTGWKKAVERTLDWVDVE